MCRRARVASRHFMAVKLAAVSCEEMSIMKIGAAHLNARPSNFAWRHRHDEAEIVVKLGEIFMRRASRRRTKW